MDPMSSYMQTPPPTRETGKGKPRQPSFNLQHQTPLQFSPSESVAYSPEGPLTTHNYHDASDSFVGNGYHDFDFQQVNAHTHGGFEGNGDPYLMSPLQNKGRPATFTSGSFVDPAIFNQPQKKLVIGPVPKPRGNAPMIPYQTQTEMHEAQKNAREAFRRASQPLPFRPRPMRKEVTMRVDSRHRAFVETHHVPDESAVHDDSSDDDDAPYMHKRPGLLPSAAINVNTANHDRPSTAQAAIAAAKHATSDRAIAQPKPRRRSAVDSASFGAEPVHHATTDSVRFPAASRAPRYTKFDGTVNCKCGDSKGQGWMLQCGQCQAWSHTGCVGYQKKEDTPQQFTCSFCQLIMVHDDFDSVQA